MSTNAERIFVDTNILVYAHDRQAGKKHAIAREKIAHLWHSPVLPALSIQVLQELYVNLIRKEVPAAEARQTVLDYLWWEVILNDGDLLRTGIDLRERWRISFWDALVLAAARQARADILWSEDFNPDQEYDGIRVVNPLLS